MGKQSQLLLQPTEVELGLQVRVEFDKNTINFYIHEEETFFVDPPSSPKFYIILNMRMVGPPTQPVG